MKGSSSSRIPEEIEVKDDVICVSEGDEEKTIDYFHENVFQGKEPKETAETSDSDLVVLESEGEGPGEKENDQMEKNLEKYSKFEFVDIEQNEDIERIENIEVGLESTGGSGKDDDMAIKNTVDKESTSTPLVSRSGSGGGGGGGVEGAVGLGVYDDMAMNKESPLSLVSRRGSSRSLSPVMDLEVIKEASEQEILEIETSEKNKEKPSTAKTDVCSDNGENEEVDLIAAIEDMVGNNSLNQ